MELLPTEFRSTRVAMPSEGNAFEPFAQAIAGLAGKWEDYACDWPPSADDRASGYTRSAEEVRELLLDSANEASLARVDAALARRELQYPDFTGMEYAKIVSLLSFEQTAIFSRLQRLRSKLFTAEGRLERAVAEIERLLLCADRMLQGGGLIMHAMNDLIGLQSGLWGCRSLFDAKLAAADARRLLAAVCACRLPSVGLRESAVIDVNWSLQDLAARFPDDATRDQLFDFVVDWFFPPSLTASASEQSDALWKPDVLANRRQKCREALVRILETHPRPFDKQDYLRRWAAQAARSLLDYDAPRHNALPWRRLLPWLATRMTPLALQRRRYERERIWPYCSFPSPLNSPFDDPDTELLDQVNEGLVAELQLLTHESLDRCKQNLSKRENPLGQLLLSGTSSKTCGFLARLGDGALAITQAVAAIGVFEIEQRRLPGDLREILSAGLLPALPVDPYSGRPLQYDRELGLVWSVGERKDPALASRGDPPWRRRLVWQMKSSQGSTASRWQTWRKRLPPRDRGRDRPAGGD